MCYTIVVLSHLYSILLASLPFYRLLNYHIAILFIILLCSVAVFSSAAVDLTNSPGTRALTSSTAMSSPTKNNRRGRVSEKASSFHGRTQETMTVAKLNRPRTVPDLLAGKRVAGGSPSEVKPAKLTKLLLNVTVQRSLGPVMVIMSPESTVGDLIAAVLRQYAKEGRRPIIGTDNCAAFDLHYSQFSLESLDREEKLINLGSRNFFMCPRKMETPECGGGITPAATCWKEAGKGTAKNGWLKFIDFLF